MREPLLGGAGFTPATKEDKREFKRLVNRIPNLSPEEWRTLQRIEWGLTEPEYLALKLSEYLALKIPKKDAG